jgi:hypothetical protein
LPFAAFGVKVMLDTVVGAGGLVGPPSPGLDGLLRRLGRDQAVAPADDCGEKSGGAKARSTPAQRVPIGLEDRRGKIS